MPDIVDPLKRKVMMAGIRSKNTRSEMLIRQALFAKGYRYRLHQKNLPGKPDLILPKYRAAIFVNGCFWHCHDCHLFKWPTTREDFWKNKILSNKARDAINKNALLQAGWRVLLVWECALKGKTRRNLEELIAEIEAWISGKLSELTISGRDEGHHHV